ncbi:MAG: hypothetical protein HC836_46595 [Richelia sp. RM2_1_2]|nr:hypothetical protein [Richelia sp. RM2_1_2]
MDNKINRLGSFSEEYERYGRFYTPYQYQFDHVFSQNGAVRLIQKTSDNCYTFIDLSSLGRGMDFTPETIVIGIHLLDSPLDTKLGKALYA